MGKQSNPIISQANNGRQYLQVVAIVLMVIVASVSGTGIAVADNGGATDTTVADYADKETGIVETSGLRVAINDWRSGDIETDLLLDVIGAWWTSESVISDDELEIHHIDVGQADSTLVIAPNGETILIDSGDWRQDGSNVIAYLEEQDIERIDHLVATHAHADHIGGHAAVIEHFEEKGDGVGAVYDSGVPSTSQTYENYLDAVDEYNISLFEVAEGDSLTVGGTDVTFFNPPAGESGDNLDYNSLVFTIEYGEITYLTTGDAGSTAEKRMVREWGEELDADIYQAGHHGSSTSSTQSFMDTVDPEMAVISSDYDSQYDHPHDEVLKRFGEMNIKTYWTGVHSNVVVTTDGAEVTVEPTKEFSTDPDDLLDEKPTEESSLSITPVMMELQTQY